MIPTRAYFQLLRSHLRPHRPRVVVLALVLFASLGLQLFNPQLIRRFIDGAVAGDGVSRLIPYAVTFMLIAVAHQAFAVFATYLAEDIGWAATNRLRSDLTDHVLSLDMSFHKAHSAGSLIERIDGDVTSLSNFFSAMVLKVVGNGLLVTGVLVLLFLESWVVGLAIGLFVVVAMAAMIRFHHIAVPWWKAVRATSAEFMGFVGEQVEGTEDIQGNGAAPYMLQRFTDLQRRWLPETVRAWMGWGVLWTVSVLVFAVSVTIVFVLGARLFDAGTLTLGTVYLVFHYVEMTRHPIEQIRSQLEDLQKAGAAIERVAEIQATTSRLRPDGDDHVADGPLRVEFDGVTFAYDDEAGDETVLHDVSFDIAAGRIVGVLGRTGSGKSTIARLVTRLHEPQEGEVRVGGLATWDVPATELRARVGMVTQDVQLFRATVRDNLTFFDPGVSDATLLEVIERLELREWLDSLPAGLDTVLEAGGAGLSAGQAQLLAFTRIFLENPGVVILDEASSKLDPATEALIERAVDHLLEGRTALIIAHRLATVTRADDILILDGGRVVEYGDRRTLAGDEGSRLAQLLRTGMEEVLA